MMKSVHCVGTAPSCAIALCGEVGIGKTSLVRSFLEQARTARGVLVGTYDDLLTPQVRCPLRDVARAGAGPLDGAPVEGDRDAILSAIAELAIRRARRCS